MSIIETAYGATVAAIAGYAAVLGVVRHAE